MKFAMRSYKLCENFFQRITFYWDVFLIISIIVTGFLVTFQIVYDSSVYWQWIVIYIGDGIFFLSIIFRFFRSYTDERGEKIADLEGIAKKYLSSYFILDVISIIPIEIIAFGLPKRDVQEYFLAAFRLNRYIRLYRVWLFLRE